MSVTFKFLVLM